MVGLGALLIVLLFAATVNAQAVTISTQPSLYPGFDETVTDYVVRCTGAPVDVTVSAPAGTTVNVDGQGAQSGSFNASVGLHEGQEFPILVTTGPNTTIYYVRCLASDFPTWTFQRVGQPEVEWFTAAPRSNSPPVGVSPTYVAIYDTNGVPVWWMKAGRTPLDFHPLSNGNVVWTYGNSDEEHSLDGRLMRTLTAVGAGISSDEHEALLLPNGNYLLIAERTLPGMSFCGQSNLTIIDYGYQEITPGHSLVRQWFASDHIPLSEIPAAWCNQILSSATGGFYDVYHQNSVDPVGNDVVMSFRHLDAVYRVNGSDGSIQWKLGGTSRAESLTILNDPVFTTGPGFGGQHDARVLSDGTVSIHDNGFHPGGSLQHPPRAARYAIDTGAGTATLVQQVNDPASLSAAGCCGSARRLPAGDWLISWGNDNLVTELTSSGGRVFNLSFASGFFSYRSHPILPGTLSRVDLRTNMDVRFPRAYPHPKGASPIRVPLVPAGQPCVVPNRTHGAPLAYGSCAPPAAASTHVSVGTPDANDAAAKAVGYVRLDAQLNPSPTSNDLLISASTSDVRCINAASTVCADSNAQAGPDYAGSLQATVALRITDRDYSPSDTGTTQDMAYAFAMPCQSTASTAVGSTCAVSTSANAIAAGAVKTGARAIWQLGAVQVFDGGSSGSAGAPDATLFEDQGVFVP